MAIKPRTTPLLPVTGDSFRFAPDSALLSTDGTRVRALIERVYSEFATYRLSPEFDACLHCFMPQDLAYLQRTPIKALTPGDCWELASNLVWTLGSVSDVNYFLPRLVEHFADGGHVVSVDSVLERFINASDLWTDTQREAVCDALFAIRKAVGDDLGGFHMQSVGDLLNTLSHPRQDS